jgi:hypothetical protein
VFLVAVKEMMGNIHKWLSIIYGIAAVISSTIGHWAKRVRDVEVKKTQLLDFYPLARKVMVTIFWSCEGSILLNVMQRGMTVNSDTIPACRKMKFFQCVWHDKNLYEILLQHNSTRPHTSVKSQEAITQLDGWSYLIHPTALRFSPLWTPERCCLWKEV